MEFECCFFGGVCKSVGFHSKSFKVSEKRGPTVGFVKLEGDRVIHSQVSTISQQFVKEFQERGTHLTIEFLIFDHLQRILLGLL